jgi:hypothetical protein
MSSAGCGQKIALEKFGQPSMDTHPAGGWNRAITSGVAEVEVMVCSIDPLHT